MSFSDPLRLEALPMDGVKRKWRLLADFRYFSQLLNRQILVPEGFTTDLASVPRVFWSIFSPSDSYLHPAIVHDWLYSVHCPLAITRKQADQVFLEAMKVSGVRWTRRRLVYRAVRIGGARSWRKK